MLKKNKSQWKAWVNQWQHTGHALKKIKNNEIRAANTQQAIELLNDAFEIACKQQKLSDTSGLVEMQALIQKSHK